MLAGKNSAAPSAYKARPNKIPDLYEKSANEYGGRNSHDAVTKIEGKLNHAALRVANKEYVFKCFN